MRYKFSCNNRGAKFLSVEIQIDNIVGGDLVVCLPAWRPGRYELGNFAKNVQKFEAFAKSGKILPVEKRDNHSWVIKTGRNKSCTIYYNYYANKLDAGSTWVDDEQIYINPVNCCVYVEGREDEECLVWLNVPVYYTIATGLDRQEDSWFYASNFDRLADTPIIASESIQEETYKVKDTLFHLWFQGECRPHWKKLKKDFKAFTKVQLELMGDFPFDEYHFLFQIAPYKTYHGVEHLDSTVIALGPGYEIMEPTLYKELLGVSSHELFHAWNIKSIRPDDLLPYDFSKENYSKMGYLAEGVTTYYGDLMLARSGGLKKKEFFDILNKTLDRHFYNYGRFNKSVADSSFETWLDGYSRGIPNRKTSIYVEGCLLALATDLMLRAASKNKKSLDKVVKNLYQKYAKKSVGITEEIYKNELTSQAKIKVEELFEQYYNGTNDYLPLLQEAFQWVGMEVVKQPNISALASGFGCYLMPGTSKVLFVAPNSPAYFEGLNPEDEIIAVNNIPTDANSTDKWVAYFDNEIEIQVKKDGLIHELNLKKSGQTYFDKHVLKEVVSPTKKQKEAFKAWLGD